MRRALADFVIEGPATTIPFHRNLVDHPVFVAGGATTSFISDHPEVLPEPAKTETSPLPTDIDEPLNLLVEVGGRRFETTVRGITQAANGTKSPSRNRRATRSAASAGTHQGNGDMLTSPVQGTVIRVAIEPGDPVKQGQLVAVVEAMKMENELTAHKDGVISAVRVSAGGTLAVGDTVAMIADAS